MKPLFVSILLLLCSACIQLGSETEPTRYYLLEPTAEIAAESNMQHLSIDLEPIILPSHLDRPQIVSRSADGAVSVASHDRWAEPLQENFSRTLQENLYRRLGNILISTGPWQNAPTASYRIKLDVNRFDAILERQTEVDIRWAIYRSSENRELLRGHFSAQIPINNSYQGMVQGLNAALARFSTELATVLEQYEHSQTN